MKSNYLLFVLLFLYLPAFPMQTYEQNLKRSISCDTIQTDSVITLTDTLRNVTVTAGQVTRYDDHLLLYPDKDQRQHAANGFDVMKNMMLPGVNVDTRSGRISALGQQATIYVNGLPADATDIRMLRPKDIERIEYYDAPKGKYAKDRLAVNFVAKEYTYGGYVMANASQIIGFSHGNYNASTTLSRGKMTYSVFAGSGYTDLDEIRTKGTEHFKLPAGDVTRVSSANTKYRRNNEYGQFRIRYRTEKTNITSYVGLNRSATPSNTKHGTITANGMTSESIARTRQSSLSPMAGISVEHSWNNNQMLTFTAGGSYSHNKYGRSYAEQGFTTLTNSKEDAANFGLSANYTRYGDKWSATAYASFNGKLYDSEYSGTYTAGQRLWQSNASTFVSYRRFLTQRLDLTAFAGVNRQTYDLSGTKRNTQLSPTAGFNLQCRTKHGMMAWFTSYTKPTYDANQINDTRIDVNRYLAIQGSPRLNNPWSLFSSLYYNGQFGRLGVSLSIQHTFTRNYRAATFYLEGNKVIKSYTSKGNMYIGYASASASYSLTDHVKATGSVAFTHVNVHASLNKHDNNVTGSLGLNCYLKDFSIQPYVRFYSRMLYPGLMQTYATPLNYGLKTSYSHKNLYMAFDAIIPFNKAKQRNWLDTPVYSSDEETCSRGNYRYCEISVTYSFDFGRRVERVNKQEYKADSSLMKV